MEFTSSRRSVTPTGPVRFCVAALVVVGLLASASAAQADTIAVTRTDDPAGAGTCPADCSLRQAVAVANPGDTIQLGGSSGSPSVYHLTQATQITVSKALTIEGNGADATTIDGSQNFDNGRRWPFERIMKVTAGTVDIHDLTFANGDDQNDENFQSCSPCETLTGNGGGALFNDSGGTLTLEHVAFDSNSGPVGGAVASDGSLQMTDVSFAHDGGAIGGGLFVRSGTTSANGATFENEGGGFGGGSAFIFDGTANLTNTTVVGGGQASGLGGGIENYGGTLTLLNDTLSNNLRGSLQTDVGASTSVQNTIIGSGFSDGSDFDCVAAGKQTNNDRMTANAVTTDLGNNIDEDGACGLSGPGDVSSVSAHLAPIGDNGGPVRTEALLHGSPAIDGANSAACPATDARGIARPGGACDIGAFEAQLLGSPSASTDDATDVASSNARLVGTINLAGEAGAYHFKWGTAPDALNNTTPDAAAGVVSSPSSVSDALNGLNADTTYYYEVVADNASGSTTASNVKSFTTLAGPPVVSNVNVDTITDTTAHVHFDIDPAGADTQYQINYGPTSSYGQHTASVDIGSTPGAQHLTKALTGLDPNTTYHFDVVATNSQAPDGVDSGDQQFDTQRQLQGFADSAVTLHDSGDFGICPSASIDWGDGTSPTAGTVVCTDDGEDGQAYAVTAHHTYSHAGHFPIHVDYRNQSNPEDELGHLDLWALIATKPPNNTALPSISGTPAAGNTLTCDKGTWSGSVPQSYAYRWLRDNVVISGQTAATYDVKAADAGHALKCRVTGTNAGGSDTATSAAVVVKSPPENTAAPKVTGTPKVGKTLTCNKGTWSGSTPIGYSYRWLRNGVAIAGANNASYVAKVADQNKSISCKVTATNAAGSASKTSAAVKVT